MESKRPSYIEEGREKEEVKEFLFSEKNKIEKTRGSGFVFTLR